MIAENIFKVPLYMHCLLYKLPSCLEKAVANIINSEVIAINEACFIETDTPQINMLC